MSVTATETSTIVHPETPQLAEVPDDRNSHILVMRNTDSTWRPSGHYSLPWRYTFGMPYGPARDLCLTLNRLVDADPSRHLWHCVIKLKQGFSVASVSVPNEWWPRDEFTLPPGTWAERLYNLEARSMVRDLNKRFMSQPGPIRQWACVVKELRK